MTRNWYNEIRYPALKTKREITKYVKWQQFTKGTRCKPNEQLFPRQVVIQLPKYVTHIVGGPKYKYGQQEQVTVRNHNRSTALERSVLKYRGLKPVLQVPNLALSFLKIPKFNQFSPKIHLNWYPCHRFHRMKCKNGTNIDKKMWIWGGFHERF